MFKEKNPVYPEKADFVFQSHSQNEDSSDEIESTSIFKAFRKTKSNISKLVLDSTFNFLPKEERIRKIYNDTVIKISTRQRRDRDDNSLYRIFSYVIGGEFEALDKLLNKYEKTVEKEFNDLDRLEELRKYICIADVVGANIFHIAYLSRKYDIARYLVRRYPQWAYKPYPKGSFDNPYQSNKNYDDKKIPDSMKELISQFKDNEKKLKSLTNENEFSAKIEELGLYTGENILHIAIVHRNLEEVRWLLNFYWDHIHSIEKGLPELLNAQAIGTFFQKEKGGVNFGTTPLQFAVCSNDQEIFKLVYSFCALLNEDTPDVTKTTKASSISGSNTDFGPKSIFKCDQNGNNALHLCVIHSLPDMYECVYDTAVELIIRELRKVYCGLNPKEEFDFDNKDMSSFKKSNKKNIYPLKDYEKKDTDDDYEGFEIPCEWLDLYDSLTLKKTPIITPKKEMLETWLVKEANKVVIADFAVALNQDLHSPLTLAASIIKRENHSKREYSENVLKKKVDMFKFLFHKLKTTDWQYGPITMSTLNLEGVEINHSIIERYEIDELKSKKLGQNLALMLECYKDGKNHENYADEKIKKWSEILLKKMKNMHPAISWLCINKSHEAICIPEIREIIENKWKRMGYSFFMLSFVLHSIICFMVTLISIFINATPSPYSIYPTEIIADILYAIVSLIFFILFLQQLFNLFVFQSWLYVRGVAFFDEIIRFFKIFSFVSFLICKALEVNIGEKNEKFSRNGATVFFNPELNQAIKISLTICLITSWIHLYYFLLGFDKTGRVILTILHTLSCNEMLHFLFFYAIILISFGCALAMLANNGNNHAGYGFFLSLETIWCLIQDMVGFQVPTHFVINLDPEDGSFTPRMNWIADILVTAYYFLVGILMLNLLIALMNKAFEDYQRISEKLLLIAKYNIMDAMECRMEPYERKENRQKYAKIDDFDEDGEKLASDTTSSKRLKLNIHDHIYEKPKLKKCEFQNLTENESWWNEKNNTNRNYQNALFIIDPQIDFHEGGSLAVKGATEDSERIAKMIDNYGSHIHQIYVSLDSHYPKHIAHAICWKHKDSKVPIELQNVRDNGKVADDKPYDINFHPVPLTEIKNKDIMDGTWIYQFEDKDSQTWVRSYTKKLEFQTKLKLTIWPEHCIIGSNGHSVIPVINDALQKWALKSDRPVVYVMKGQNIRTEMYSALSADVKVPNDISTALNEELLIKLKASDKLIICGQAMSHSVNYTTRDLIDHWGTNLSNLVLLTDGASPVPGSESKAEEFKHYSKEKGVTLTTCKDAFEGYTYSETADKLDHELSEELAKSLKDKLLKFAIDLDKCNPKEFDDRLSYLLGKLTSISKQLKVKKEVNDNNINNNNPESPTHLNTPKLNRKIIRKSIQSLTSK